MIAEYLSMTVKALIHRPVRTFLTLIGILIGVAAVVSLISLGQGLQDAIASEFAKSGGDKLIIQAKSSGFGAPGTLAGGLITSEDIDRIESVNGVSKAAGTLLKPIQLEFNKRTSTQYAFSIPTDDSAELIQEAMALEIDNGRMLKKNDRGKAVVGSDLTSKDLFGKAVTIGDTILVNNTVFKVIGVFKRKGDPGLDKGVAVNEDDLRPMLELAKDELHLIYARVAKGISPEDAAPDVLRALRRARHEKEGLETVEVQTLTEILQSFTQIFAVVQAVLVGIAMISFVVGAVGIMNTMYTSVVERTREIGIMKAVGASNHQILLLFFCESALLGFLGGSLGAAIGAAMSKLVEIGADQAFGSPLIRAAYPPALIIVSISIATIIGVIAGILPAMQAAKQKPVDAIRYD